MNISRVAFFTTRWYTYDETIFHEPHRDCLVEERVRESHERNDWPSRDRGEFTVHEIGNTVGCTTELQVSDLSYVVCIFPIFMKDIDR